MKELESILQILCNHQDGSILSEAESIELASWLRDSRASKVLFEDLSNPLVYEKQPGGKFSRETIWSRLIANEEG